ncbi:MAG TPA: tripartite tricarboxylate transporter substrate binding protein [Burkholderiales bacterium]|nr:tripartite tricarboxylate transporter substrate binding protein [Burkholderiales bacterium]
MSARSLLTVVVSAVLTLVAAAVHAAQSAYPTKPIRFIIPFPPGGSADPLGRALGAWLSDKLGVPVVADNRPGAGTAIAHTLGARAAPDGYTLLLAAASGMSTNPAVTPKLDYDPVKDFAPVGLAAYVPQLFVVHPAVQAKTIAELIDLSKAQPGKVNFGTPGVGTVGHLTVAFFSTVGGAKFTHVPYKGAGLALPDVVAGRIQVFVGSVTSSQTLVAGGRVRGIATGHIKRLRSMPDMPTVGEAFPGFSNDGWYGIVAPVRTPPAVINKLNAELRRALGNAEFTKHVETIGMEPAAGNTPKELGDWIRSELERWSKVVRDAGIQGQAGAAG